MDAELQPEPDTILPDGLTEQMKLEGSSNDTDHNTFIRGDEVNLVGDGIPGYETTGVDGTDDQIADEIAASMQPNPMNIP